MKTPVPTKKIRATARKTPEPATAAREPQQARSIQTKKAICEATEREIERTGLDKLTTKRIAQAAGVSVGGLYEHFPNKEAIVAEITIRWLNQNREMIDSLSPVLTGCGDLMRYIENLNSAVLKIYMDQPGIGALIRALQSMPSLQPILAEHDAHVTKTIAKAICSLLPNVDRKKAGIAAKTILIISHELLCEIVLRDRANAKLFQHQLRILQHALTTQLILENG